MERLITFTQFLLPDGKQRATHFSTEDSFLTQKASELKEKDFLFEIELLQTDRVYIEIRHIENEHKFINVIVENGPSIPRAVARCINQAYELYLLESEKTNDA